MSARALEYWTSSLGLLAPAEEVAAVSRRMRVPARLAGALGPDAAAGASALLERVEEAGASAHDRYGNPLAAQSILHRTGLLEEPVLDQAGRGLLEALALSGGTPVLRKLPWPGGAPMAASLGHDIDDPVKGQLGYGALLLGSGLLRFRRASLALGWDRTRAWLRHGGGRRDPYLNFGRYREIEAARGMRSTFFVVPMLDGDFEVRYRFDRAPVREALLETVQAGWEVAVHGSNHSASDAARLALERRRLSDLVGPVSGIRQHNLRWEREGSWRRQAQAGFRYDSSVAYNEALGFRAGACFPYRAAEGGEVLPLWELPLSLMETYLYRMADPAPAVLRYVDVVKEVGGLLTVNWHERVLHEPDFPGMGALYGALLDRLRSAGAWVPTARDLVDWWESREALTATSWAREGGDGGGWTVRLRAGAALKGMVLESSCREGTRRIALPDLAAGQEFPLRLEAS